MYEKILVPLDGSKTAETILPNVEKLAKLLSLEVFSLRVVRMIPWAYGAHDRIPMDTVDIEQSVDGVQGVLDLDPVGILRP